MLHLQPQTTNRLTEVPKSTSLITSPIFSGSLRWLEKVLSFGIIFKVLHNLALTYLFGFTFRCVRTRARTHTHTLSLSLSLSLSLLKTTSLCTYQNICHCLSTPALLSLSDNQLLKDKKLVLLIFPYFYLWAWCLTCNKYGKNRVNDMNCSEVGTTSFQLCYYHLSWCQEYQKPSIFFEHALSEYAFFVSLNLLSVLVYYVLSTVFD